MLMLGVKRDEPVHFGNGLGRVIVDQIGPKWVTLAIDFPKSISVNRESREIQDTEDASFSPATCLDGLVAQIVREDRNGHPTLCVKIYTPDVGEKDRTTEGDPIFHIDTCAHFPDRDGRLKSQKPPTLENEIRHN